MGQTYKSNIPQIGLKYTKSDIKKTKITSSKDACNTIREFYGDDINIYESVFMLMLNRANNTTGWVKISQGGVAGTVIDIKIICKYAIDHLASGVILAHNHPSGNIQPSVSDKNITKKLRESLKIMDVTLLDHLIIADDSYLSMADEDMLNK